MENWLNRLLYYLFKILFKIFYKVMFCYEARGSENIPETGGVIIAANHLSYLDPPLVGISIKRPAVYMAKESLFRNPLIAWFVRAFSIPVDRESPKPSTIKTAVDLLKKDHVLVIFPEGGRRRGTDTSGGRRGVGMIAALSKAKVVPALIEGTDKALPVGAILPRPAKVRITFGTPLEIGSTETSKEYQQRLSEIIMDRIKELKEK